MKYIVRDTVSSKYDRNGKKYLLFKRTYHKVPDDYKLKYNEGFVSYLDTILTP